MLALTGHRHSDSINDIVLSAGTMVQVRTAIFAGGSSAARRITLTPDHIDIYATNRPDTLLRVLKLPPAPR